MKIIANISAELSTLGFPGATTTELRTFYPSECPPILIQLPSDTNMLKFKQIKYLANCSVEVERYKPNKKPGTQCFRCQGFGHASRNCNRPPRCVKCAQSHPTWECPKKDRDSPAICCNCQQDHPANFAKCDERLKYLGRLESRRETLRKIKTPNPAHGNTWAQIASTNKGRKAKTIPEKIQPNPMIDLRAPEWPSRSNARSPTIKIQAQPTLDSGSTIEKPTQDLETMEMLEILATIQSVKQEFKKCKTFMDKVILVLTHLGHYV